jgi:2-hydroxychromene-2-carboxylate isomerase
MAHFAQLDENNIVQQVIVVDNEHAPTEEAGVTYIKDVLKHDGLWLQTSYNNNIRGKFAGKMDIYDPEKNEFVVNTAYLEQQQTLELEQQEKIQIELTKKEVYLYQFICYQSK